MTLNDKARRLLEVKALIASLEKEKTQIEDEFKQEGPFQTDNYNVSVSDMTRSYLKGVEAVAKVFGHDSLVANGLISETTYKVVKVSLKNKMAA